MSEPIACCGFHLDCQLKGECVNSDASHIDRCTLREKVISYKFPLLYQLKQKRVIEVESNHLTETGKNYLMERLETMGKLEGLLMTIYILGLRNNKRLDPKDIHLKWSEMCKDFEL